MNNKLGRVGFGVVAVGLIWLGAQFAGFKGVGKGGGDQATPTKTSEPTPNKPSQDDDPTKIEPVIQVTISANKYLVSGRSETAATIAQRAVSRIDPTTKQPAPAKVAVVRAEDATAGAQDDLIKTLEAKKVFYQVD